MTMSVRIRKARALNGFSQTVLATKLGVNRSAVANWESALKQPSSSHLQKLALVTKVSFEWLATGRGSPGLQEDWTPAIDAEFVDDPEEVQLLRVFRACTRSQRRELLKAIVSRSSKAGSSRGA